MKLSYNLLLEIIEEMFSNSQSQNPIMKFIVSGIGPLFAFLEIMRSVKDYNIKTKKTTVVFVSSSF